jgi:hypothetical protein
MEKGVVLSFYVESIVERKPCGCVQIFETILRDYTTHETITITGRPWKVGEKVDFREIRFRLNIS